jgi:hypothetical protein
VRFVPIDEDDFQRKLTEPALVKATPTFNRAMIIRRRSTLSAAFSSEQRGYGGKYRVNGG